MKLTIERNTLAAGIAKVQGVIEKRNIIPILSNIAFRTTDDGLTLCGTDLDIEVTTTIPAVVTDPGMGTVAADLLASIVKGLPNGGSLEMTVDNRRLYLTCGKSKFDFATLDYEDYPHVSSGDYASTFNMASSDLSRLLGKASFAMSNEETRYYLNGVYLHNTEEGITAVATDGHRLAKVWIDQSEEFPSVIVPRKTVSEIRKLLDIGDVELSVSEGKIRVDMGDTVIVSKVIDETFPDYTRVIPKGNSNNARVDALEFSAAASLVAKVSEDKSRCVGITVSDGGIAMECKGGLNSGQAEVEADVDGQDVKIGINSKYLVDILAQAEGGSVDFIYGGPMDPMIFKPTEDDKFIAVSMPMRF